MLVCHPANAQAKVFYPTTTSVSTTVTATAIVGYGNQSDFNTHLNGTSPTVTIVAGAVINQGIAAYNASNLDLSGGTVYANAVVHDTAILNVTGGVSDALNAYDNAFINFSGGLTYSIGGNGNSTVIVSGGTVQRPLGFVSAPQFGGSSTTNISGGTWFLSPEARQGATVRISGGQFFSTVESGGSGAVEAPTVTITGGVFDVTGGVEFLDSSSGSFTFVGTGLSAVAIGSDGQGGTDYQLAGTLMNGDSIAGDVIDVEPGARMFALVSAPEPSQTVALGLGVLGLAGLAFKARKRRSVA